jgi:lipoprotein-anchoring transpeptidase ErfK/SrfK
VRGPFAEKLPTKMEEMKELPALAYRNPSEKIAEKFRMSEELLIALNLERNFNRAGEKVFVVNPGPDALGAKIARIEVDKTKQILRAFDRNGKLIAFYPVTAGSIEKPAPTGRLRITRVSKNPTYRYNPAYAFKGVAATEPFTINPGPNNPAGSVWIALSREGYGIHGTPEPSKVSKSESHGCIRLTNWDALQLASGVVKGTLVDFSGDEGQRPKAKKAKRNRRGSAK